MNLEQMYKEHENKRVKGTNDQIKFFSNYLIKSKIEDLEGYIKKNWNTEIWEILESILEGEKVNEDLRKKLYRWNIERRTLEEYLVKIFYSWFVEDSVFNWLNSQKWVTDRYVVIKGGTDSSRELVSANKATGDPDLYVKDKVNGDIIHLEVSSDNSAYTIRKGLHDLRHRTNGMSKYEELQSKRNDDGVDKVFLLIVDTVNVNIAFLPIDDDTKVERIYQNWNYGGRLCTELQVEKDLKRYPITL